MSILVKKWSSRGICKIYDFEYVTYAHAWFVKACMMHSSWYKMWDRQTFLSFWAIFCPFTPLTTCKTNILKNEKMKKAPGDIIFLHLGNTNDNYMMYASCDMERDRIFCHFRPFLPCYPQQPKKSKFWKNGNKNLVILSFYISVLKIMIICSTIPDIWHVINFYFSFFLGFFFFFLLYLKNQD